MAHLDDTEDQLVLHSKNFKAAELFSQQSSARLREFVIAIDAEGRDRIHAFLLSLGCLEGAVIDATDGDVRMALEVLFDFALFMHYLLAFDNRVHTDDFATALVLAMERHCDTIIAPWKVELDVDFKGDAIARTSPALRAICADETGNVAWIAALVRDHLDSLCTDVCTSRMLCAKASDDISCHMEWIDGVTRSVNVAAASAAGFAKPKEGAKQDINNHTSRSRMHSILALRRASVFAK